MRVIVELKVPSEAGQRWQKVQGFESLTQAGFAPNDLYEESVIPMEAESIVEAEVRMTGEERELEHVALGSLPKLPPEIPSNPAEVQTLVGGEVDADALPKLRSNPLVVDIYEDPPIDYFPIDCTAGIVKGTAESVAKYLGLADLWALGYTGGKVAIGICDTGVNSAHVPVADGWTPNPAIPVGQDGGAFPHGSMTAFDARSMAPDVEIYDIGVLKPAAGGNFLSTALQGFQWAIDSFRRSGKPQILSNSWGIYQEAWSPQYARDPNHIFTRKVVEAIRLGMIVTFAAGNCGSACPDGRCATDTGPGRSIWGANGHPWVITVGAVNLSEEWIGYSSEGPSPLFPLKPNVCGISHFEGYVKRHLGAEYSDAGTSAACPIVSGGIAVLKEAVPGTYQFQTMYALHETAKNPQSTGHDTRHGYGIVDFWEAANVLMSALPLRK